MAADLGLSNPLSGMIPSTQVMMIWGFSFLFCIFSGVILFLILRMLQFKHTVIINQIVNNATRVITRKARIKRDRRSQAVVYVLAKEKGIKKHMPEPPDYAITIGDKGQNVVQCWRTESGEYFFKKEEIKIAEEPKDLYDNIPKELIEEKDLIKRDKLIEQWRRKVRQEWMNREGITIVSKPITTNQRIMHFNQIQKANEGMKKTLLEMVPMFAAVLMVLMVIVGGIVLLSMWGDITKPSIDAKKIDLQQQELYLETAQILSAVKQDVQIIKQQNANQEQRLDQITNK